MNSKLGLVSVTVASPQIKVADPIYNAKSIIDFMGSLKESKWSDIVLFPELCISGYTCGDLFNQSVLRRDVVTALCMIAEANHHWNRLVVVGLPVAVGNSLYNCAAVISDNNLLGIVPKSFLPNYKEFYEARWFKASDGTEPKAIDTPFGKTPFGTDLLFKSKYGTVKVGVEICEDVWVPIPPSCFQAIAGANILLNLSASNEVVAKSAYRRDLVVNQSARCIAAYAYASSGPSESTSDLVFGGHCLIAENGTLLSETKKFPDETDSITRHVDLEKIENERLRTTTFGDSKKFSNREFREIEFWISDNEETKNLRRSVAGRPFVPRKNAELKERCEEIFNIQVCGLAKRMAITGFDKKNGHNWHFGISGGLDSTQVAVVLAKACDRVGVPRKRITAITMPGFGTTAKTKNNAIKLAEQLGFTLKTIDIRETCLRVFLDMGHSPFGIKLTTEYIRTPSLGEEYQESIPFTVLQLTEALGKIPKEKRNDVVFENVQARVRTLELMSHGFVVGTGDLSEAALGWCTYNGDHMSMYNPNCSIPKTLIKFLVEYSANYEFAEDEPKTAKILLDIAATTISPELLPVGKDGEIEHSTEDILGPYELHDFFLFNMIRNGFGRDKILFLACKADFEGEYEPKFIEQCLDKFYNRFFANQFKRNCVPDGPKVGTVSLSPRGDWRMPSDASNSSWLREDEDRE